MTNLLDGNSHSERDDAGAPSSAVSRRQFLSTGTAGAVAAAAATASVIGPAAAQQPPAAPAPGRAILIKNGHVLTLDRALGDFENADVLIEGKTITAVRPNITAPNAEVIDAARMIVMPGLVDTHRHMWQGILRNVLARRLARGLSRRRAAHLRRQIYARRRLCRRPLQRARRDRQRRDLRARLVAHPQQPRPHRRRRQGAVRIRAPAPCSPTATGRTRPAATGRSRPASFPATSRACASSTSRATTSSSRSISPRRRARPSRYCPPSRPPATSARGSPSMPASASAAAAASWKSSMP